jgi:hypothetical protein
VFGQICSRVEAGSFTKDNYDCFAANYAARTSLTLPVVFANCLDAAISLHRTRTSYGALTANEESGEGKPGNVHSTLMVDALNAHGKACYESLKIEPNDIILPMRLWHIAQQLIKAERALRRRGTRAAEGLKKVGLVDLEGKRDLCLHLARSCNVPDVKDTPGPTDLKGYKRAALEQLKRKLICKCTRNYFGFQMRAIYSPRPGYIQGVGYALEGLADTSMELICHFFLATKDKRNGRAAGDKYDENLWRLVVYPYFAAHGSYWEERLGKSPSPGVEQEHEKREVEKLKELDKTLLSNAYAGAEGFAQQNTAF